MLQNLFNFFHHLEVSGIRSISFRAATFGFSPAENANAELATTAAFENWCRPCWTIFNGQLKIVLRRRLNQTTQLEVRTTQGSPPYISHQLAARKLWLRKAPFRQSQRAAVAAVQQYHNRHSQICQMISLCNSFPSVLYGMFSLQSFSKYQVVVFLEAKGAFALASVEKKSTQSSQN